MAETGLVQIFNTRGTLMIRNDIQALTCTASGEFPPCLKQYGPMDEGVNTKYFAPEYINSWIDISGYTDPIIAIRPAEGVYASLTIAYWKGKMYAVCISDYYEQPEYFIFERKAQRLSDYGLQLYHPTTGAVTFDSCWDFMMPEKIINVPFYATVNHGLSLKTPPAFVPLNLGWCAWNSTPNGSRLRSALGLATSTTTIRSSSCDITDRTYPNVYGLRSDINAMLINVDHL